jgi:cysteine desulfurase
VYLDYAAATPLSKEVYRAMLPFLTASFGNPSSISQQGQLMGHAMSASRESIARILGTEAHTIIFTSGGTEANNLAILGCALKTGAKNHLITSSIEHHAVLGPVEHLHEQGWQVTYASVNAQGLINVQEVIDSIKPETILVSVMYANNELGTIEPIAELGKAIMRYRQEHNTPYPYFHTDACQAANNLNLNVEKLHVDLMSLNSGKVYGPAGVGLLYVRKGVLLQPLLYGGNQEFGLRPGTENVAGIVGFATALEQAERKKRHRNKKIRDLALYFFQNLKKIFSDIELHGPEIGEGRLPGNLNIFFKNFDAETLLLYLDRFGVAASAGSACSLQSHDQSHVLKALRIPSEHLERSVRFSLGAATTKKDIEYVLQVFSKIKQLFLLS